MISNNDTQHYKSDRLKKTAHFPTNNDKNNLVICRVNNPK